MREWGGGREGESLHFGSCTPSPIGLIRHGFVLGPGIFAFLPRCALGLARPRAAICAFQLVLTGTNGPPSFRAFTLAAPVRCSLAMRLALVSRAKRGV